jgi:hypothetical protein
MQRPQLVHEPKIISVYSHVHLERVLMLEAFELCKTLLILYSVLCGAAFPVMGKDWYYICDYAQGHELEVIKMLYKHFCQSSLYTFLKL